MRQLKLALFLVISVNFASAQSSFTGCLLPNNIIYRTAFTEPFGVTTNYYKASGTTGLLPANRCSWTYTSTSDCIVSTAQTYKGIPFFGGHYEYANQQHGKKGVFTASTIGCPIDDYAWVLLALTGGIGFYLLKKRTFSIA